MGDVPPIDWPTLTRLVPEIAIVLVFIWFTLERDKRRDSSEEKRDHLWREFLSKQQERYADALARLAEEIKESTKTQAGMQAVLIQHDVQAREFISREEARESNALQRRKG